MGMCDLGRILKTNNDKPLTSLLYGVVDGSEPLGYENHCPWPYVYDVKNKRCIAPPSTTPTPKCSQCIKPTQRYGAFFDPERFMYFAMSPKGFVTILALVASAIIIVKALKATKTKAKSKPKIRVGKNHPVMGEPVDDKLFTVGEGCKRVDKDSVECKGARK